MPCTVSMQGYLLSFQHPCATHMSPRRQHMCISLEVQQCLKPTSSLCQSVWLSLWLTQDLSLHPRKQQQTPSDFKGARPEMQQQTHYNLSEYTLDIVMLDMKIIILTNSLVLEWITLKFSQYWFTKQVIPQWPGISTFDTEKPTAFKILQIHELWEMVAQHTGTHSPFSHNYILRSPITLVCRQCKSYQKLSKMKSRLPTHHMISVKCSKKADGQEVAVASTLLTFPYCLFYR